MKKLLLLTFAAMIGSAAYADESVFQIVDANGNNVSGQTIECKAAEVTDPILGTSAVYANAGLAVKNVTVGAQQCKMTYTISDITHGQHQICFTSCVVKETVGTFELDYKAIKGGKQQGFMAEWFPYDVNGNVIDGSCTVTYSTEVYTASKQGNEYVYTKSGDGPSVTIKYYQGEAGVGSIDSDKEVASETYYDLCGCQVANPSFGLYIKRVVYSDGSVESTKVSIK